MSTASAPEAASVGALAGGHVRGRRHEWSRAHRQPGAPELRAEQSTIQGVVARRRGFGAAQLTGDDQVSGAKFGRERARDADEGDRRLLVEPGGELRPRSTGTGAPGADDRVGAAVGEGLDPKRREDLELSRWDVLP